MVTQSIMAFYRREGIEGIIFNPFYRYMGC